MSLWKDGENLFEARPVRRPARPGALRARLPVRGRAEGPREGVHRGDRPNGDLVQAARRRSTGERRDVGAGLRELRLQQPHPDAAHPGPRTHRGPHGRRVVQPGTTAATVVLAAGLDGIERGLDPGEPNALNLYETDEAQRKELGIDVLPANLLDATRELERCRRAARRAGPRARRGLPRLLRQDASAANGSRPHEQITQWELSPLPAAVRSAANSGPLARLQVHG